MILFWMTRKGKCLRWLRSYSSQLSVWSIFSIHICTWESSMQDRCRDCWQSTKNAFVWPFQSKILPILTAIRKNFCVDVCQWMKHWSATFSGITTFRKEERFEAYYAALLDRLVDEIRKKRLHLKKKKSFFIMTNYHLQTWTRTRITTNSNSSRRPNKSIIQNSRIRNRSNRQNTKNTTKFGLKSPPKINNHETTMRKPTKKGGTKKKKATLQNPFLFFFLSSSFVFTSHNHLHKKNYLRDASVLLQHPLQN